MNERTRSRLSRADRPQRTLSDYVRADVVIIIVAIAAVVVVGLVALDEPDRVGRLTVSNPTEFDVAVDISSSETGPWLPVALVDPGMTRGYDQVLDQGGTWVFRYRAQGRDGGVVTIARSDLAAAGWTIGVPDVVVQRLRAAGAPPSPCSGAHCPPAG
jgi:hypothetical protein